MKTSRLFYPAALLGASLTLANPAFAQTVTGQIAATMTLTSTCHVNGASGTSNVDFGTVDFGSADTLFSTADGQLISTAGNGFSIQCTPGSSVSLTLLSGVNDADTSGGHEHALKNTTSAHFIPYSLYTDTARSAVLAKNTPLPIVADGTVQTVPLYARAFGADGLVGGTYTDTISVQVNF